jgi:hypothetical protein
VAGNQRHARDAIRARNARQLLEKARGPVRPESCYTGTRVPTDRIDFISAYCDRWCERCAFTERCSVFAVKVAEAMCDGNLEAAMELAIGQPQPVEGEREPTAGERLMNEIGDLTISDKEMEEFSRLEKARRARLERDPLSKMAHTYTMRAADWLTAHRERLATHADPAVREAVEILGWDVWLVGAKIGRALHGRDESRTGELPDVHPVQNDWNGSAKVALISLARSESAWRAIAEVAQEERASVFADGLGHLRRALERDFPEAMAFVRPGFDDVR